MHGPINIRVNFHISHLETDNAQMYCKHHFIDTMSTRHVSASRRPSSGSTAHTLQQQEQQNELPDIKLRK